MRPLIHQKGAQQKPCQRNKENHMKNNDLNQTSIDIKTKLQTAVRKARRTKRRLFGAVDSRKIAAVVGVASAAAVGKLGAEMLERSPSEHHFYEMSVAIPMSRISPHPAGSFLILSYDWDRDKTTLLLWSRDEVEAYWSRFGSGVDDDSIFWALVARLDDSDKTLGGKIVRPDRAAS